jgi:hypothetical protein
MSDPRGRAFAPLTAMLLGSLLPGCDAELEARVEKTAVGCDLVVAHASRVGVTFGAGGIAPGGKSGEIRSKLTTAIVAPFSTAVTITDGESHKTLEVPFTCTHVDWGLTPADPVGDHLVPEEKAALLVTKAQGIEGAYLELRDEKVRFKTLPHAVVSFDGLAVTAGDDGIVEIGRDELLLCPSATPTMFLGKNRRTLRCPAQVTAPGRPPYSGSLGFQLGAGAAELLARSATVVRRGPAAVARRKDVMLVADPEAPRVVGGSDEVTLGQIGRMALVERTDTTVSTCTYELSGGSKIHKRRVQREERWTVREVDPPRVVTTKSFVAGPPEPCPDESVATVWKKDGQARATTEPIRGKFDDEAVKRFLEGALQAP